MRSAPEIVLTDRTYDYPVCKRPATCSNTVSGIAIGIWTACIYK